jgi:hypothetical protein
MQVYQNLKLLLSYSLLTTLFRIYQGVIDTSKNILRSGSKNVLAYSSAEAIHVIFFNEK